eukprot:scaffold437298_cov45-Prasinocladus_malaysianus.AAC.3
MGGGKALIDALVRGLEKFGGRLLLRAHVDQVIVESGKATGVRLRPRGRRPAETIRGQLRPHGCGSARPRRPMRASYICTSESMPPGWASWSAITSSSTHGRTSSVYYKQQPYYLLIHPNSLYCT